MHLLKQLTIADLHSPYDGQLCDLRIADGQLVEIGPQLASKASETVVEMKGHYVSPGFFDIGAYLGDPGHEDREDITSLAAAAIRGGYTSVAVLPNTDPVRHDKSGIRYLQERSKGLDVHLLPLGAISRDTAGKDITEMIDMHQAGALAFTDGLRPVNDAGLMLRALEYAKSFGGIIINQPLQAKLAAGAQIHEGPMSTQLGMLGFSALSETLAVHRDLELLAYTQSKLLLHLISSAQSVELLRKAKQQDLQVAATVSAMHLQFTVDELANFDVNFKISPPLREESDRQALIEAVLDGTIDGIVSHHIGCTTEEKELEFPYADFGSLGLETAFGQAATVLAARISPSRLAALFSHGPRKALGVERLHIQEGAAAELTFFQLAASWEVEPTDLASKNHNTPMLGRKLSAKPSGVYSFGKMKLF